MEGGSGGGEMGRRGSSKFTSYQGAGRAKLAFVDKGALTYTLGKGGLKRTSLV